MVLFVRWGLGGALLVFCAWVCAANASILWTWYVRKRRPPSWIPLIGGTSGAVGLWLLPSAAAHKWWWLPLIVDWGSVPGISHAIIYHLIVRRNRQPPPASSGSSHPSKARGKTREKPKTRDGHLSP